ncbi:cysteine desulfurase family protein [Limnochorda pilosa]|uniref:cysteine desulfurase family protein n=1 Tax=Limnochorda pilosa TaxID=1555112 RepID=UPI000AEAA5E5|nr:cysteine desulfurase family protein [Limnochorda pilosa]
MRIYMDHAATTPLRPDVLEAMEPYLTEAYGNASSFHAEGQRARHALDEARATTARVLGAEPAEIVFTSGGSEANTMALVGAALARRGGGDRVVVSSVEHPSVLESAQFLARLGFRVTELPVDRAGQVDPEVLAAAMREGAVLVSVQVANNEVGTLQPVEELCRLAHEAGALFHTDAVQAVGLLPVDVNRIGCDLLSLSAHKFQGPKGVGALYVRKGLELERLVHGGGQERSRRAGTENVAAIVGLARALELAAAAREGHTRRLEALRDRLVRGILGRVEGARLTGHPSRRLPGLASFVFEGGVEGESLLVRLDMDGVAASSGSACTSGSLEPSHVLLACGFPADLARSALRLSLGPPNTEAEVERVVEVVTRAVERLRRARAAETA